MITAQLLCSTCSSLSTRPDSNISEHHKNTGAPKNVKNIRSSSEVTKLKIAPAQSKTSCLGSDKRVEPYQHLIDLLVMLQENEPGKGYDRKAFNYLEIRNSQGFLDDFEVTKIDTQRGINLVLANREKDVILDISRAYIKLLSTGISPGDKNKISHQIKTLEGQIEVLKREMRILSPAYSDLKHPRVITYDEVRNELLAPDEEYFTYSLGKQASYAFAISRKGLKIFGLPGRNVLRQQVIAYRKGISDWLNQDFQLGHKLYQELVSPAIEAGLKRIVFVPDDILNLLPFETLLTKQESCSWLIQEFEIGYIPSFSALRILRQRHQNNQKPPMDLLAIGDPTYGKSNRGSGIIPAVDIFYSSGSSLDKTLSPLKYSEVEVQSILQLFSRDKVTVLKRMRASERWLKSNPLTNYKIIHFATHSAINDKKPARSAIILSFNKDNPGEGLLEARDIYGLKLNANLVTLSACQTGLGQFIRGEGIEGLSRAFFYAGSSAVLTSLWAVNDQATSLLMERFYRHVLKSESLMGALQNAKLEMIRSGALSHPYYWAGFVINGEADSKIFSGNPNLTIILASPIVISMIVILALVTYLSRKSLPPIQAQSGRRQS